MSAAIRSPRRVSTVTDQDDHYQHAHMLRPTTQWVPDLDAALRRGTPRIVVGIGEESGDQLCERTSLALAEALGIEPIRFPSDHIGFVGDPDGFAARLRAVLHGESDHEGAARTPRNGAGRVPRHLTARVRPRLGMGAHSARSSPTGGGPFL